MPLNPANGHFETAHGSAHDWTRGPQPLLPDNPADFQPVNEFIEALPAGSPHANHADGNYHELVDHNHVREFYRRRGQAEPPAPTGATFGLPADHPIDPATFRPVSQDQVQAQQATAAGGGDTGGNAGTEV